MTDKATSRHGERKCDDLRMRDEYIRTGKVPFGLMVRKGLSSLFRDPLLMFVANLPGPIGMKLRQVYWCRLFGSAGNGIVIDPDVDIIGPSNVYLDDFVYLGRKTQLVAPEGYIKIGKRCHIVSWILGHGGVEIGNYVACSGAILSATDSHQGGYRMSGPMIPPEQRRIHKAKVVIEDDAFIGHYSIIMPGVRIGHGAIVGPNSLVVINVKPWTVVMGSPAKVIGKRDTVKFPDMD